MDLDPSTSRGRVIIGAALGLIVALGAATWLFVLDDDEEPQRFCDAALALNYDLDYEMTYRDQHPLNLNCFPHGRFGDGGPGGASGSVVPAIEVDCTITYPADWEGERVERISPTSSNGYCGDGYQLVDEETGDLYVVTVEDYIEFGPYGEQG